MIIIGRLKPSYSNRFLGGKCGDGGLERIQAVSQLAETQQNVHGCNLTILFRLALELLFHLFEPIAERQKGVARALEYAIGRHAAKTKQSGQIIGRLISTRA
jgi:hypothetical protein